MATILHTLGLDAGMPEDQLIGAFQICTEVIGADVAVVDVVVVHFVVDRRGAFAGGIGVGCYCEG